MTERPAPDECLGVEVSGPFAHFRKIGGNSTRQTYRSIPRTTAAGMLAAILGLDRDSYYDLFDTDASSMAVVPVSPLRTMSVAISELATAPESPKNIDDLGAEIDLETGIETVNRASMESRQRNPYQMLRDVRYRLYVALDDRETYDQLATYLREGRAHYTPYLGLSECLASVEFLGRCNVVETDESEVDSILPDHELEVLPAENVQYWRERAPADMEALESGGRRTTEFVTQTIRADGKSIAVSDSVPVFAIQPRDDQATDWAPDHVVWF